MKKLFCLFILFLFLGLEACSNSESAAATQKEPDYLESLALNDFALIRSKGNSVVLGTDDTSASVKDRPSMVASFDYDYLIGKHEVTCGEMALDCSDSLPATNVTFFDAVLYANKLSSLNGLDTAYTYTKASFDEEGSCVALEGLVFHSEKNAFRLPTEAEWIYAAQKDWNPAKSWNSKNSGFELHPVCSMKNADSICDMAGNAMEWVGDLLVTFQAKGVANFVGGMAVGGVEERVLKGGSFRNEPLAMHLYNRGDVYAVTSSTKAPYVGFRLAFGAIPEPSYMDLQGNVGAVSYSVLVGRSRVNEFVGQFFSKMVFRDDYSDNLVYVDFSAENAIVSEMNVGVSAYHPDISPDGKYVAFSTGFEGIPGKSEVYVRQLSGGESEILKLNVGSAAIPRWRVLDNGDTVIVYVTSAADNKQESSFLQQETWQVPFKDGSFGTPKKLFNGAYHGGVAGDLAVTGSKLLRARVHGKDKVWYNGEQACNVSLSQGGARQTLFLDFAGKTGQNFVGTSYGTHQRALIADSLGNLVLSVAAPEKFSFDHTEWIQASDSLFVATLANVNGAHQKVVLVNSVTGEMLELVSGMEVWHPVFWAQEKDPDFSWNLDSLGFYYTENGQPTHYLSQKMSIFWTYRDSAEIVGLGNSHMQAGFVADFMSRFAINMSAVPCDMHCVEFLYENYISLHVKNLKYLIVSLDFDLWGENDAGGAMQMNTGDAPGFKYDENHGFWENQIDSLFVQRVNEIVAPYTLYEQIRMSRGWMHTPCVPDWDSKGEKFAEVIEDSTWSDDPARYEANFSALLRVLALAKEQNITVVGVLFPISPYYKNTGSYGRHGMRRSTAKKVMERVERLALDNSHFILMDENKMGNHDYAGDVAFDYDHLCWQGAATFTHRLDSLLKTLE